MKDMETNHELKYELNQYDVSDDAKDLVIDELNIAQASVLHSGVRNNFQQIHIAGTNIEDFFRRVH